MKQALVLAVVAASASLLAGCQANAQVQPATQQPATVSVDLTRISKTIADRLGVDEANMPLSMQVPHEEAVQLCGAQSPGLVGAGRTGGSCTAASSSASLDRMIQSRMKADETPPEPKAMGAGPAPTKPAPATPAPAR